MTMTAPGRATLGKEERMCSRRLTELLFTGNGSHSMVAFPLRAVYRETERREGDGQVQILVSVPKRLLRQAVRRNRVRRQVREAYRLHKEILISRMSSRPDRKLLVGFIWLDRELHDSKLVGQRVVNLLVRISEKI